MAPPPRRPRDYRPDLRPMLLLIALLGVVVLCWVFLSALAAPGALSSLSGTDGRRTRVLRRRGAWRSRPLRRPDRASAGATAGTRPTRAPRPGRRGRRGRAAQAVGRGAAE